MPQRQRTVGVRFRRAGRIVYFDPGDFDLRLHDMVVAELGEGLQVARVVIAPDQVLEMGLGGPLRLIVRKATERDLREFSSSHPQERT